MQALDQHYNTLKEDDLELENVKILDAEILKDWKAGMYPM
ncbi:hypothetical protein NHP190012_08390 [Helicobacter sp. NHP19-012]|uniref:Uncharacterized protein n=1 Tax=Helicobacter gastrofelis TaxID=2849642 RepID=A0ABM7SH50_9HELI|nr:hypothetical protein NHP190012_08390 [Helicobacter sp. NHP19-012]GMB95973.1 hypothetical protein NHP22001_05620 [Helicobacter sp. NHP22-001]